MNELLPEAMAHDPALALLWLNAGLLVVLLLVVVFRQPRDPEPVLRDELRMSREETAVTARLLREEVTHAQRESTETMASWFRAMNQAQHQRLEGITRELAELSATNESRLESLRAAIEAQLARIRQGNEDKLEQMRRTVDEQLQGTLEKRLGESFKIVSDRLEAVHKGLGEMQQLASGVGDLKRVLTNVKTRGTWGEVQLGALLEQVLTPSQYAQNVKPVPGSNEIVEYAIRLPGADDDPASTVWLPIDAKFPQEDYQRLVDASEAGDAKRVQEALAALGRTLETAAADIRAKYIEPPYTTDFGVLFLPTEGLYAEVTRQPDLLERLQRTHRVVAAGPTTLAAILNSLQMGFRTLAIERRSSEVWKVLSAVKTEFGKFGDVLDRVKKQLDTASKSIDQTGVRSRAIEKRLRNVEDLPVASSDQEGLALDEPFEPFEPFEPVEAVEAVDYPDDAVSESGAGRA